jgi:hypothetical protein
MSRQADGSPILAVVQGDPMIPVLIIVFLVLFVSASISPLLISEETADLVYREYRLPEPNPCSE